ncbi:hypothetical protein H10PHJ05_59 [Aeromonas phage HJ05]|nr:hypothetical protein H10PHJ05_59 [Aeromonas phage HJ05]
MVVHISTSALILLVMGHLIAICGGVVVTAREYRAEARPHILAMAVYVVFLSCLSVLALVPAFDYMAWPPILQNAAEVMRNAASVFFLIGLGHILSGRNPPKKVH